MAYASSVSAPFQKSVDPLTQRPTGFTAVSGSSLVVGYPRTWGYVSTADAIATILASSYFSDGWDRGMRPGDIVEIINSTSTASSTGVTLTRALVVSYSTVGSGPYPRGPVGVSLSTAGVIN